MSAGLILNLLNNLNKNILGGQKKDPVHYCQYWIKTYFSKSLVLCGWSLPLDMTLMKSSVSTNGTLSRFIPNFFFLWFKK